METFQMKISAPEIKKFFKMLRKYIYFDLLISRNKQMFLKKIFLQYFVFSEIRKTCVSANNSAIAQITSNKILFYVLQMKTNNK